VRLLPPLSTLFPYTTLFRSPCRRWEARSPSGLLGPFSGLRLLLFLFFLFLLLDDGLLGPLDLAAGLLDERARAFGDLDLLQRDLDRKSTRLNSSHVAISYAV